MTSRRLRAVTSVLVCLSISATLVLGPGCTASDTGAEVDAPSAVHSDHDQIPDELEIALGSDHTNADTDGDGLPDFVELFPDGVPAADDQSSLDAPYRDPVFGTAIALAATGTVTATGAVNATGSADATDSTGATDATTPAIDPDQALYDAIADAVEDPPDSDGDGLHDVIDPFEGPFDYKIEGDIVGHIHASIQRDHPEALASGEAYTAAFLEILRDPARSYAPMPYVFVDPSSGAKEDRSTLDGPANPDAYTTPVTKASAVAAWAETEFDIMFWKGFADADRDGIPNAYEYYGYTVDRSTGRLLPWGIEPIGSALQRRAPSTLLQPLYPLPPADDDSTPILMARGLGSSVDFAFGEARDASDLDYSVQYFKSNPHGSNSDFDPDNDYKEGHLGDHDLLVQSLDPWRRPTVSAAPAFSITLDNVKLTPTAGTAPTYGDGSSVTTTTQSIQDQLKAVIGQGIQMLPALLASDDAVYPEGVALAEEPTVPAEGEAQAKSGIAEITELAQAASGLIGQVMGAYTTLTTSGGDPNTVTGDATFELELGCKLMNEGPVPVKDVTPAFDVYLAGDLVGSYPNDAHAADTVDVKAARSASFTAKIPGVSLEHWREFRAGNKFTIVPRVVDGQVGEIGPDGAFTPLGSWQDYRNPANPRLGTIVVAISDEDGTPYTQQYSVMATRHDGPPVTLRDALQWTVADYPGATFTLPASGIDKDAGGTVPVELDECAYIFDREHAVTDPHSGRTYTVGYTTDDISDPLDTLIKPNTVVYVVGLDRLNQLPAVAWAQYRDSDPGFDYVMTYTRDVTAQIAEPGDYLGSATVHVESMGERHEMQPVGNGRYHTSWTSGSRPNDRPKVIVTIDAVQADGTTVEQSTPSFFCNDAGDVPRPSVSSIDKGSGFLGIGDSWTRGFTITNTSDWAYVQLTGFTLSFGDKTYNTDFAPDPVLPPGGTWRVTENDPDLTRKTGDWNGSSDEVKDASNYTVWFNVLNPE